MTREETAWDDALEEAARAIAESGKIKKKEDLAYILSLLNDLRKEKMD